MSQDKIERHGIDRMKKKIIAVLMMGCMVFGLCACNNSGTKTETKEETTQSTSQDKESKELDKIEVEKYVTLGDYKNLTIDVAEPTVSDEEVDYYMNQQFSSLITAEVGITDRAVENGDTVNIDFEGKKDGVAFDGGTATGSNLTIGSGQFIPGFEEGLIGVAVGETVDLPLTFPEGYTSEELAGQDVVFTVTVNYILPEMSDEVIAAAGNENFSNVAEFRDYVYNNLLAYANNNYASQMEQAIIQAVIDCSEFAEELPSNLMEKYRANILLNMTTTAANYGMDAETFATAAYGTDLETLVNQYALDSTKQGVAFQAIANAEGLVLTEEELDAALLEYAKASGYESLEEYLGDTGKDEYKEFFMFLKIIDFLKEANGIVTE